VRLQPRKSPLLVGAYEPAEARDIRGENSGQPAFEALGGQSGAPQPHGPNGLSALDVILTVNAKRGTPFWWTGPMSASEANGS